MGSLTDYFAKIAYQPKYHIGDRVFGRWNGIPFIGSVGNDRDIGNGPEITITPDLPVRQNGKTHHILIVKHRDIRPLKIFP